MGATFLSKAFERVLLIDPMLRCIMTSFSVKDSGVYRIAGRAVTLKPPRTLYHTRCEYLTVGAYIRGSTLLSPKSNMSTIGESPAFEMPPANTPTVRLVYAIRETKVKWQRCAHTHAGEQIETQRKAANCCRDSGTHSNIIY